jgi:hypothetical protein
MWAKHSKIPATLADLVGEYGKMKTTKKNKTKKKSWRWDPFHQQAFGNINATITKEVVLAHPEFLKPLKMYTDASPQSDLEPL